MKKVSFFSCGFFRAQFLSKGAMGAFSLVEMLMALLVASLLLVALSPVLTKRQGKTITLDGLNNVSQGGGFKLFLPSDADCTDVAGQNYKKCKFRTPKDVYKINITLQGAGGGGSASTRGVNKKCAYDTKNGKLSGSSTDCLNVSPSCTPIYEHKIPCKEIPIEKGIFNFEGIVIGPGGGGGGAVGRMECNSTNHQYLTAAQNGGAAACVTKYNAGESLGPSLIGINVLPYTSSCSGQNCCFESANTGCDNSQNLSYGGCKRVVCKYVAGKNACDNYYPAGKWRLPFQSEFAAWASHLSEINTSKGSDGLMLCDSAKNITGLNQCAAISGCAGWACFPYALTGNVEGSSYAEHYLSGGVFNPASDSGEHAQSIRCITTDSSLYGWKAYSGSGGSSGAVVKNTPNAKMDEFVRTQTGEQGTFYIFAGNGYKGADAVALSKTTSNDGEQRTKQWDAGIVLHRTTGYMNFYGTFGGGGYNSTNASDSLHGIGGKLFQAAAAPFYPGNCYNPYNLDSTYGYSCTPGNKGNAGTSNSNGASTGKGGNGGSLAYTLNGVNTNCTGGVGGSVASGSQNGGNATCYGAGGGGASSYSNANGKGGNGGSGYAKISYDIKRRGAAGGGGGGGAFVIIEDISVKPDTEYYVYVGKGGKGGNAASDVPIGTDGGDSWFQIETSGKVIAGGGKAGKSGNDVDNTPVGGVGGDGGKYSNAQKAKAKYNGLSGANGLWNASKNLSAGGAGGMGHTSETIACGGFYNKNDYATGALNCTNTNALGQTVYPPNFAMFLAQVLNNSKTDVGQGGAGGGYSGAPGVGTYGNGGNGTDGYVLIRW